MSGATVGIDARKVRDFGIGRYIEGLLRALAGGEGDERYVLFVSPDPDRGLPPSLREALPGDRFRTVPLAAPLYSARELLAFRGAARRFGLDLLHFPHYVRALAPGCPVVVTIHDAIHLEYAGSVAARGYARAMMTWSVRSAARTLTVSEAARADLARRLRVPHDRIRVTPNGVDARFTPPEPAAVREFRARHGLADPFVLCMATHRPHKNLPAAVEAFRRADLDAAFVVPARDRNAGAHLAPFLATGRMRLAEAVPDDELPLLYAAARLVLCPSLEEGFGLPGLEAAACGAAVLASPIPAHREVLGEAAAFAEH
ncbi:glycosyltransferase family 4 protein, partial [bacterium]|nr:glycosyltransferase family 4 protein [bacterium]